MQVNLTRHRVQHALRLAAGAVSLGMTLAIAPASCVCKEHPPASATRSTSAANAVLTPAVATPKRPVTDTFHGTQVVEEYRWLEDAASPEVQAWSDAQNAAARAKLDALACAGAVRARVEELENAASVDYFGIHPVHSSSGVLYFASKSQPPKPQPLLVVLSSLDDPKSERVLLDPAVLDPTGSTSIDWFFPSPDGQLLAVSLSKGGSESGDVHVYDVSTGAERPNDTVTGVNGGTAGGWLAWSSDEHGHTRGFYCTMYPRPGTRPPEDMAFFTQVYFHALGSAGTERFEVGKDYPKIAEVVIETSDRMFPAANGKVGEWTLTNVQNGDGGEFIQDIRSPEGTWTRLTTWADRIVEAKFGTGADHAIYLVSRKNAPNGKVLRLPLSGGVAPSLANAVEVIPERADGSIETSFFDRTGLFPAPSRVYVQYQSGGPNELAAYAVDTTGSKQFRKLGIVPQEPISTIEGVQPIPGSDDLIFRSDAFTSPPSWSSLAVNKQLGSDLGKVHRTALAVSTPPGMPALKVVREFATSKDGTKVPVSIVMRADLTPGANTPAIVWGYGGYGVNETPGFSRRRIVWLEQGGIFATANIRGGGEFGEHWHLEGNLTKKQNCFDDFYSVCKHLISSGYTSKDRLAIMGGSNGGLLMGAMVTQHPDLCRAVVSSVGIYDMLRVELSSNGAFNITEFGTVNDAAQFKALYAYSPYHHVVDGTRYPAILFMTGANDPRVDPMQSRKMTARLQAADPSGTFLLRTSANSGHGAGTPLRERIEQTVDQYSFLFDQLGVKYKPVTK